MNYYNNDNDYYHYDDNTTITQWENKQTINETLQLQMTMIQWKMTTNKLQYIKRQQNTNRMMMVLEQSIKLVLGTKHIYRHMTAG